MTAYTIDLTVGPASWSFARVATPGEPVALVDGAAVLDNLTLSWAGPERFPGQPEPGLLTLGVYVQDGSLGTVRPQQGDDVHLVVSTDDYDPVATPDLEPVAEFHGRCTDADVEAVTRNGLPGVAFSVVAVDYTADLVETRIGDTPWVEESAPNRVANLKAASAAAGVPVSGKHEWAALVDGNPAWDGLLYTIATMGNSAVFSARDIDSQPALAVWEEHLRELVKVYFPDPDTRWGPNSWSAPFQSGPYLHPYPSGETIATVKGNREFWYRPYLAYRWDETTGTRDFVLTFVSTRHPSRRAMRFYMDTTDGTFRLTPKAVSALTVGDGSVAWIPADVCLRDGTRWRQDKASAPNRFRATGSFVPRLGDVNSRVGSYTAQYADLVEANGPVEVAQEGALTSNAAPLTMQWKAALGKWYDAQARYALDSVTVLPETLPGHQWPRFFPFSDPSKGDTFYRGHYGRPVHILGIAPEWNMHPGGHYFGMLTGATLTVAEGRVQVAATLLHRAPGVYGPDNHVKVNEVPVGIAVNEVDPSVRVLDLGWTDDTEE